MLRIGCLLVFMLIGAGIALAAKFLPWWGTLLVIIAAGVFLVVLLPRMIGRGAVKMFEKMLEEKSRVLRDAQVIVHEMTWVDPPAPPMESVIDEAADDGDENDYEEDYDEDFEDTQLLQSLPHLRMIVTIIPAPQAGQMAHYEPNELTIVPFDKATDFESLKNQSTEFDSSEDDMTPDTPITRLTEIATDEGGWNDDYDKVVGEQKLRLLFAMPPDLVGRVKFNYYLEGFGDFILPEKPGRSLPAE